MPLPSPHPFGTSPTYGVIGTSRDTEDFDEDSECVPGARINKMSADLIAVHDAESAKRTVVDKTASYVIQASDNGKTFRDSGAAGAASARPLTMPVTAGQRHVFVGKSGNGLRIEPASGTVKYGEASGSYIELTTLGLLELIGDGTDLIVVNLTGSFSGVS